MLFGITGHLGSGKTLALTWMAIQQWIEGRDIYSNYNLKIPHYYVRNTNFIDNMRDGFACMDELWLWADSYKFMTKKTQFVNKVLAKSRKRGFDIGYTTQTPKQVAKRIREITDYWVFPDLNKAETKCRLKFIDMEGTETYRTFATAPIFAMYNTNEEIEEDD